VSLAAYSLLGVLMVEIEVEFGVGNLVYCGCRLFVVNQNFCFFREYGRDRSFRSKGEFLWSRFVLS
jgi:hypothetical protein